MASTEDMNPSIETRNQKHNILETNITKGSRVKHENSTKSSTSAAISSLLDQAFSSSSHVPPPGTTTAATTTTTVPSLSSFSYQPLEIHLCCSIFDSFVYWLEAFTWLLNDPQITQWAYDTDGLFRFELSKNFHQNTSNQRHPWVPNIDSFSHINFNIINPKKLHLLVHAVNEIVIDIHNNNGIQKHNQKYVNHFHLKNK